MVLDVRLSEILLFEKDVRSLVRLSDIKCGKWLPDEVTVGNE
jgi:hypothetical protein